MFDWLFGCKKKEGKPWVMRFPEPYPSIPFAPMHAFTGNVAKVKEEQRKLLTACLTGGMSYEDAKKAVQSETAEEMALAKKSDAKAKEINEEAHKIFMRQIAEHEAEVERWKKRKGESK